MYQYYRVAAAVPDMRVADTAYNVDQMLQKVEEAKQKGVNLITFPELSVTGYTCGDLFLQQTLLTESKKEAARFVQTTADCDIIVVFGMPLSIANALYNVAVTAYRGHIYGITVKTFLPNYNEFYEKRWFSSARELSTDHICASELLGSVKCDYDIPLGNNLIYHLPDAFCFGAEICEDLWAPIPPSAFMAMSGAELILNLSASNDTIGKREYREKLVKEKSTSLMCTYLYASAGANESTTDLIFSGHCMICEGGKMLAENSGIAENNYLLVADGGRGLWATVFHGA